MIFGSHLGGLSDQTKKEGREVDTIHVKDSRSYQWAKFSRLGLSGFQCEATTKSTHMELLDEGLALALRQDRLADQMTTLL